jgi:hypothetical protein
MMKIPFEVKFKMAGDFWTRKGVALEGIPSECPGRPGSQGGGADSGSLAFAPALNKAAPEEEESSVAKPYFTAK